MKKKHLFWISNTELFFIRHLKLDSPLGELIGAQIEFFVNYHLDVLVATA